MDEKQWFEAADSARMIETLKERMPDADWEGRRKLLLFSASCCRRIWDLLPDDRCGRGVEVAEREADGEATADEVIEAGRAAADAACHYGARADRASGDAYCQIGDYLYRSNEWEDRYEKMCQREAVAAESAELSHSHRESTQASAAIAACETLWFLCLHRSDGPWNDAATAVYFSRLPVPEAESEEPGVHYMSGIRDEEELAAQRVLVDCVFGNPFRPVSECRDWLTPSVVSLARAAYEARPPFRPTRRRPVGRAYRRPGRSRLR